MNEIGDILAQHFPGERWHITQPPAGLQQETYLAAGERRKLFLKFDTDVRTLQRLADIGAAPALVAAGEHAGRAYTIQRYVEGTTPDRHWFVQNLATAARLVNSYHRDPLLKELLALPQPETYAQHMRKEVMALEEALALAGGATFEGARFRHAFHLFRSQATRLQPLPLVPVHPDPSPGNMLVTHTGIIFVDWDGVRLSDPMHDAGLMAWWYLPQVRWVEFCAACGEPFEEQRVFWWAARRSLEVALWFDARRMAAQTQAFLDDFYRAVGLRPNPKMDR